MAQPRKIAILGASGYTGAELVRIIASHPDMQIFAMTADRKAGQTMGSVFPHLAYLDLPLLTKIEEVDFTDIDLAFCALPHGVTHGLVKSLPEDVKVVDLSADFRLRDAADYTKWYSLEHTAMDIQATVAYGLPEFYRQDIAKARVVANTGCYVATGLLPLIPLLRAGVIDPADIVIDAKSGVTGAGRSPKEGILFSEVSEGFQAYGVASHRHLGEFDQELSLAAGTDVKVSFTPHLLPQNRGIYATIYAKGSAETVLATLQQQFEKERFVHVLPMGEIPATRHARGSNMCLIGVKADRTPGRVIIISTLDNLMKGASGQAVQNANLMLGLDEAAGLEFAPMFP